MKLLIFAILYLAIPPGILGLGKLLKNEMIYSLYGRRRSRTAVNQEELKEGFNRRLKKRLNFTLHDNRNKPIPYRIVFLGIYIAGLIMAILSAVLGMWKLLLISFIVQYVSYGFAYKSADGIITARETVLGRMTELKSSAMGLAEKGKGVAVNPANEFKVLEWSEDLTFPLKMYVYLPITFDRLRIDEFMRSFNLSFSSNGQWVADIKDENYRGFDFNEGVAAIAVTPPLPQRADWNKRYLNPQHIHWSYFPLALGSENGVPVPNEETGEIENVLGFAVNSGQEKLSKKNDVIIGSEITAAPQVLIAGGTGGGKALSVDTLVATVADD